MLSANKQNGCIDQGGSVQPFFAACSTDNASRSTEATSPPKWEEQLQYGLYLAKQRGDDQLRLLSYEYLGKVKTEEEMIELTDEMFADETYTVISHFLL